MSEVELQEALMRAIELEERGYAFYKECERRTDNTTGRENHVWIIY